MGKITKFITPAKFSSCRITDERKSPSAPSINPASTSAGITLRYPRGGALIPHHHAIARNA